MIVYKNNHNIMKITNTEKVFMCPKPTISGLCKTEAIKGSLYILNVGLNGLAIKIIILVT